MLVVSGRDEVVAAGADDVRSQVDWEVTGLTIPEGLAFEDWVTLGGSLEIMDRGVQWWIGDWLNYGEKEYGEKYTQAVQETGKRHQTLQNIAWVARQVDRSRRRDTLSWSVHAEVASLEPKQQVALLEQAERQGWTRDDMRRAVKALKMAVVASGNGRVAALPAIPPRETNGASAPPPDLPSDAPEGSGAPSGPSRWEIADPGPEAGVAQTPPQMVATEPDAGDAEDDDVDPIAEWERAEREVERLTALVDQLRSASDDAARLARLDAQCRALQARVETLMAEKAEVEAYALSQKRLLERLRKMLKVRTVREIEGAVKDLIG